MKIRQGRSAANDQLAAEKARRYAEAQQIIEKALEGQDANATMQYNAYLIYVSLSVLDKPNEEKYQKRMGECIAAAMRAVRPDTPHVENIYVAMADWQMRAGNVADARKTRQAFYEAHPDNQRARLVWAWQLAVEKTEREKAIEILSKDVVPPKSIVGVGLVLHQRMVSDTLGDLVRVRLMDIESERDPQKKQTIIAAADADLDKIRALGLGSDPRVLAIEGRILNAKGKTIEAVQTLEQAYAGMKLDPSRKDFDSLLILAQIHARNRQPGRAIDICQEIVRESGNLNARLLLTQLLVNENRIAEALPHLTVLTKALPDNELVKAIGNQVVIRQGSNPAAVAQIYDKLPEENIADMRFKYEFARRAEKGDEQLRLLNKIIKTEPGDLAATLALVAIYKERQMPDKAQAAVDAALKINPNDFSLKIAKSELGGATQDQLFDQLQTKINDEPDVYRRNLALFDLYKRTNRGWDKSLEALKAANEAKPDGIEAQRLLFAEYLARGRFERCDSPPRLSCEGQRRRFWRPADAPPVPHRQGRLRRRAGDRRRAGGQVRRLRLVLVRPRAGPGSAGAVARRDRVVQPRCLSASPPTTPPCGPWSTPTTTTARPIRPKAA